MRFHVGQKVVCVDARNHFPKGTVILNGVGELIRSNGNLGGLTEGRIYTVSGFYGHSVILFEIKRAEIETGFATWRFRPLLEKKTDISVFTEILDRESYQIPVKRPEVAQ